MQYLTIPTQALGVVRWIKTHTLDPEVSSSIPDSMVLFYNDVMECLYKRNVFSSPLVASPSG